MPLSNVRPPDRLQRTAVDIASLPGATLVRTRGEAVGIWREARALSRGGESRSGRTKGPESGPPSADKVYFAYYVGLGGMAALRILEWRLAVIIAAAHTVERYGHRRRVQELVEGLEAGI